MIALRIGPRKPCEDRVCIRVWSDSTTALRMLLSLRAAGPGPNAIARRALDLALGSHRPDVGTELPEVATYGLDAFSRMMAPDGKCLPSYPTNVCHSQPPARTHAFSRAPHLCLANRCAAFSVGRHVPGVTLHINSWRRESSKIEHQSSRSHHSRAVSPIHGMGSEVHGLGVGSPARGPCARVLSRRVCKRPLGGQSASHDDGPVSGSRTVASRPRNPS